MAWYLGRYYVRLRKQGGRVVHEYVGGGLGRLMAALDARRRAERAERTAARREEAARLEALDATLDQLYETADRFARLALQGAGYHQHDRGEWRKRRDRTAQP